jgi:hypothetical protein
MINRWQAMLVDRRDDAQAVQDVEGIRLDDNAVPALRVPKTSSGDGFDFGQ